jgi:Flp pilus assembly protein TadD
MPSSEYGMSLLSHRVRRAAGLPVVALALALASCGGVPEAPLVADAPGGGLAPGNSAARSESLSRLGETALQTGETESAASLFEQAALIDGRNVRALLGLGNALLALDRDLDASRAFERALAVQADLPEAHYGYARAMIGIQRPEVAADHLRAVLKSRPNETAALNALGVAYNLLGQHELATGTYRQGLALAPTSVPLRNNLGLSLALQERFPDALATLRPLADGPGSSRRTRQNLALVYGLQGDLAAAERLSRVDLGGSDLRENLAFFATVRGLEDPTVKAAALAPPAWDEQRPPRERNASPAARRQATPARREPTAEPPAAREPAPSSDPARRPSPDPSLPRPLTLGVVGDLGASVPPVGGWFVNVGKFPDATAATERWHVLRSRHAAALQGLGKLGGASEGPEPLLLGPVADEAAARGVCSELGRDAKNCAAVRL